MSGPPYASHSHRARRAIAVKVPAITAMFWLIKGLSTALGESTSDYLVHAMAPVVAVLLGLVGFLATLAVQFAMVRYVVWSYWLAVAMVGIFGTMAADVVHVGFGVPYEISTAMYAALLAAVFLTWRTTEGTLSIHTVNSPRRELFYWMAVAATFAMGTALGDLSAFTLHLGYFVSAGIFAFLIGLAWASYRFLRLNSVLCFWTAYVITRPLGASLADGLGKPTRAGGFGLGSGPVTVALGCVILLMVGTLAFTGWDPAVPPAEQI
ncbi:MAG TPA: hypothetical protein VHC49_03315 [Mycobacteriales bacterium]|nr:hypothetical protein [Mycobacteriales bacterium]